jgi:hypothetical protein
MSEMPSDKTTYFGVGEDVTSARNPQFACDAYNFGTVGRHTPHPVKTPTHIVKIQDADGRALLTIHHDGSVEGAIADASEAGRLFALAVVNHFGLNPS